MDSTTHGGTIGGKFRFLKKDAPTDAPDNAVVFKRKLSDALIRSLTEPGKHADGIARGACRDVANHTAPLKAKTAKIEAHLLNEERTFAYVAEQWLAFKSAERVAKSVSGFSGALNNHILSAIGKKPVSAINRGWRCAYRQQLG